ncbi:DNA polymerase III subunit gamma/tau [Candidatus Phytoplasma oryzae]|nr:DNA polymerase III subunit gamma/tau [Candidatus Phytoplasma oryzae]
MSYVALYRKYRPQNFSDMIGQNVIIQTLKNSVQYDKIHHCYLFSGDKGVGKTTLAKILVKNINCISHEKEDCCNKCESCLIINNKNNLDIIEIDGATYSGVDEIRELKNKAQYKPSFLKYKIYIIDEVHVLSHNAFNALLKILEDPPANIIFILITSELRKIPKTIISRTQHFNLKNISQENIKKKLNYIINQEKIFIEENALDMISFYANGSLRDALNLLDQINSFKQNNFIQKKDIEEILGVVSKEKIEYLTNYFLKKEVVHIINALEGLLKLENINLNIFINDFIEFCQEKMIDYFKNKNDQKNFFYYLLTKQKEKFFQILFQLQQNLINSRQKKNLIIISFLEIHQFFENKKEILNKEDDDENKLIYDKDYNIKKENYIQNKEKYKKNKIIKTKFLKDFDKNEDSFIKYLKRIFLYSDEKTKDIIYKGWFKLKNFPQKDLAIAANFLYKTKLLMISYNKEMLLSCDSEDDYKRLLNNYIRNKIKLILNSKKELIKDYFVILKKDWEETLCSIYTKFKQTKDIKDLDFSSFNTIFYEQNSVLNIEQNQNTIVKIARDFFGFDKVEIVNSNEEK